MDINNITAVYFVGAGGIGMSAVSYTHLTLPTNREGKEGGRLRQDPFRSDGTVEL